MSMNADDNEDNDGVYGSVRSPLIPNRRSRAASCCVAIGLPVYNAVVSTLLLLLQLIFLIAIAVLVSSQYQHFKPLWSVVQSILALVPQLGPILSSLGPLFQFLSSVDWATVEQQAQQVVGNITVSVDDLVSFANEVKLAVPVIGVIYRQYQACSPLLKTIC